MLSGHLDQRVELYSRTEAPNASGEPVPAYTLVGTYFARVVGQKGDESFAAARTEARRTIKVLIRAPNTVAPTWRLGWNGEVYDIVDVDRSKERQGELWLMAAGRRMV